MLIAFTIISVVLAAIFLLTGIRILLAGKAVRADAAHHGYSITAFRLIGIAEIAGAVGLVIGLWVAPLGIAAAAGLALLMIGAAGSHLAKHDPVGRVAVPTVLALLSAALVVLRLTM